MKLPWTRKLLPLAFFTSGSGLVVAAGAALGVAPFAALVTVTAIAVGAVFLCLLALVVVDGEARRAVDAVNRAFTPPRDRTWSEWLLPPGLDRRLMILGWAALLEFVALKLSGREDLEILTFLSFAVTAAMAMLRLDRDPAAHRPRPQPAPRRSRWSFWIGD